MTAFIGLGGNREDSRRLIAESLQRIDQHPRIRVLRRSADYRTAPWGVTEQPDFINAVAELETRLAPWALLEVLLSIEQAFGRRRGGERWGPRCIDLDLLTYDELETRTASPLLPHPRMHERAFVLVPLLELQPDFVIPGRGPAAACLRQIDDKEIAAVRRMPPQGREDGQP